MHLFVLSHIRGILEIVNASRFLWAVLCQKNCPKKKRNGFLLGRLCYYSLTGSYDWVHCSGPRASNFNQVPCLSPCEVSPSSLSLEDKIYWLDMIFHHLVEFLGLLTLDLVWFCCLMGINCLLFMSWSPDWLNTHKHRVSMSVTRLLL